MNGNKILTYETMRHVALEIVQLGRDIPEDQWFEDATHNATSLIRRIAEEAYDEGRRGELEEAEGTPSVDRLGPTSIVAVRHSKRLDRQHLLVRSDVLLHRLEPGTLEALRRALERGLLPSDLNISGDDEPIVVLRFTRPHAG